MEPLGQILDRQPGQVGNVQASVPETLPIEVRRLQSPADYGQAVELQRITWGRNFHEVVPAAILKVTQRVGGISAGAFSPDGVLQGFLYGISGIEFGRPIHWSHMLAVRPESRDSGIGLRLKKFQQAQLALIGVELIYWTFDPLVARNAHLNLNCLGVDVRDYVPDMYGDTGSVLHEFGTDRLIVSWPIDRHVGPVTGPTPLRLEWFESAPLVHAGMGPGAGIPAVRVEVPSDVERIPVAEARAWRASTRAAFQTWIGRGFEITGFYRSAAGRCFYILSDPGLASSSQH